MKKSSSIVWGVLILIVGVIFLGNTYNLWNIEIFFKGWWTLFIIIPSIFGYTKKEWISSSLGLAVGVLLLLATRNIIEWKMVGQTFIPVCLIVIGLSFIFKPKLKTKTNQKGLPEYIGIFSSNEEKVSDDFKGCTSVAVFGGTAIDLKNAKIKNDMVIDAVCVFGSTEIILPDGITVKTSGVPIFGGIETKYESKKGPTIFINYVCIFGGIEIK